MRRPREGLLLGEGLEVEAEVEEGGCPAGAAWVASSSSSLLIAEMSASVGALFRVSILVLSSFERLPRYCSSS